MEDGVRTAPVGFPVLPLREEPSFQWASTPSVSWCRTPGSGPWFKVRANCGGSLLKLAIYGARADSG